MGKGKTWSQEEIDFLKQIDGGLSNKEIVEKFNSKFNRGFDAIMTKVYNFKTKTNQYFWTNKEDNLLKSLLKENITKNELVKKFNDAGFDKNFESIIAHMHTLKIKLSDSNLTDVRQKWTDEEDLLIRKLAKERLTDKQIIEKLKENGFNRSYESVKTKICDLKFGSRSEWTEKENNLIKKLLKRNIPLKQLKDEFDKRGFKRRSLVAIKKRIYQLGFNLNDSNIIIVNNAWSKEEDDFLRTTFVKRLSKKQLVKEFKKAGYNRSFASIAGRAKALEVKLDCSRMEFWVAKKDQDFFKEPNELNCSVVGLIASDGNLSKMSGNKKSYQMSVGLVYKDINYLRKIKKAFKYTGKIYTQIIRNTHIRINGREDFYPFRKIGVLQIRNLKNWKDDLTKHWNIVPNKTHILKPPNLSFNNIDLCLAYIQGYICGDGSVGLYKDGKNRMLCLTVCGCSKPVLEWIREVYCRFLNKELRTKVTTSKTEGYADYHCIRIRGKDAIKVFEKMKSLNCVFMYRKFECPKLLKGIAKEKARLGM